MTLLKRLITTVVLFVFFFVLFYFAICIVGGAISGGVAGAGMTDHQAAMDAGRQAGQDFVKKNLGTITLSSFMISGILSLALSFSGLLPWCRKPAPPQE